MIVIAIDRTSPGRAGSTGGDVRSAARLGLFLLGGAPAQAIGHTAHSTANTTAAATAAATPAATPSTTSKISAQTPTTARPSVANPARANRCPADTRVRRACWRNSTRCSTTGLISRPLASTANPTVTR